MTFYRRIFFIRAEGLIPRPSGAKQGVLNPTAIPYENTIPRCSAAGLVIMGVTLWRFMCDIEVSLVAPSQDGKKLQSLHFKGYKAVKLED